MQSILVPSIIAAIVLLLAFFCVSIWERISISREKKEAKPIEHDGAFRGFYHVLWILFLWSGLSLSIPLWISYHERLKSLMGFPRIVLVLKVLFFPLAILALLYYGYTKKYWGWIDSLSWPDEENK